MHLGPGGSQLLDDVGDLLRLLDGASEKQQTPRDSGYSLSGLNEHFFKRKKKFRGSKLARVEYAMLVDDMRVGMSFLIASLGTPANTAQKTKRTAS